MENQQQSQQRQERPLSYLEEDEQEIPIARVESDEEGKGNDEVIQYVTKSKLQRFFRNFKEMPETEDLLLAKSCSLEKDVMINGHLYATRNFVAFCGKFFGKKLKCIIPIRSITNIEKKKFGLISNGIKIDANDGAKMVIGSLKKRDVVFDFLNIIWKTTTDPVFLSNQLPNSASKYGLAQDYFDEDSDDSSILSESRKESDGSIKTESFRQRSSSCSSAEVSKNALESLRNRNDSLTDADGFLLVSKPEKIFLQSQNISRENRQAVVLEAKELKEERKEKKKEMKESRESKEMKDQKAKDIKEGKQRKREGSMAEPIDQYQKICLINEKLPFDPQTLFNYFYGPHKRLFCSNEIISQGEWVTIDGVETREVTCLLHPQGREKYFVEKYFVRQKVIIKENDFFLILCDIISMKGEAESGVAIGTEMIITTFFGDGGETKKSRLTLTLQSRLVKPTSRELLECLTTDITLNSKEALITLNKELAATTPSLNRSSASISLSPDSSILTQNSNFTSTSNSNSNSNSRPNSNQNTLSNSNSPVNTINETVNPNLIIQNQPVSNSSETKEIKSTEVSIKEPSSKQGIYFISVIVLLISLIIWATLHGDDLFVTKDKKFLSFIDNINSKKYDPNEIFAIYQHYKERVILGENAKFFYNQVSTLTEKLMNISKEIGD